MHSNHNEYEMVKENPKFGNGKSWNLVFEGPNGNVSIHAMHSITNESKAKVLTSLLQGPTTTRSQNNERASPGCLM
jgi:hypothetical protein